MYTLAIDIGNTSISVGVFSASAKGRSVYGGKGTRPLARQRSAHIKHFAGERGKKTVLNFKLPTHNNIGKDFYKKNILRYLNKKRIRKESIEKIIICSVVLDKTAIIKRLLSGLFKKKVLVVGKDIAVPILNRYRIPAQVGQDRLVGAYAALRFYGPGVIIIDFGTAVTFDVVSKKREYLGGLIFPGLDLSLDALYLHTALLPRIKLKKPISFVGTDTVSSINNGIVFGMAGVCDKIIERLEQKFKGYKVIATGGNVNFIKQYGRKIKFVHPHLVLEGLNLLC